MTTLELRTMAFAGICQAIDQVRNIARYGSAEADDDAVRGSINSIIVTDPDRPQDVFGDTDLSNGYDVIVEQLGDGAKKDVDLTRYLVGVLALERKLSAKPAALSMLAERLSQVKRQQHHYDVMEEQILSNLASVYSDVISPLGNRIQVVGTPAQLQQKTNQYKIRTLLLAAVRSAVLWRQLGGKRRQLVLSRKAIVATAQQAK
ncbi:high frequency lysogenization protein HflD [Ferrimonas lipolytica]|uniref:High frequency lysogenization protein HflD homolog n=1 Tax=Ferrimonas lipolytica TaxID=2724191 RepID=A0A6H1UC84_9GAMM|nr:high frequency lysogenization protein HflD [Ferrimonas lipolytica]QIZ76671.1 high frequency lysogenization protein HflD [Ferrimonas lipolytica]